MGPRDVTRSEPPQGATHFIIPAGQAEPVWFMRDCIGESDNWWLWTGKGWQWTTYRLVPAKLISLPEDCEHALPTGAGRATIPMQYMAGATGRWYPTVTLWLKKLERSVPVDGKPS
jgi:hypothetical protein